MTHCYLGLGSNLRTPRRQLHQALAQLAKLPRSQILKQSSIYLSKPCGLKAQPPYCNMVVLLQTKLPPTRLLQHCQAIENKQQRIRKRRWGARTLDIDLLLYGDACVQLHHLNIPHPEMLKRDFVLVPLIEISPHARLPNGDRLDLYRSHCENYLN